MAEYIEKWSVVNRMIDIENEFQRYKPFHGFEHAMYRKICETEIAIGKTPAADVEPLVRCMDCKYHYWEQEPCHGKTVHYCKLPHMSGVEVFKEFFCYYGERKEGAE